MRLEAKPLRGGSSRSSVQSVDWLHCWAISEPVAALLALQTGAVQHAGRPAPTTAALSRNLNVPHLHGLFHLHV